MSISWVNNSRADQPFSVLTEQQSRRSALAPTMLAPGAYLYTRRDYEGKEAIDAYQTSILPPIPPI